ncbi:hypothetical protein E4T47_04326 [Aureobasidium subglaciale]|nr:hypothetical protein E4T47_04326 [Aureobasidium subglaciale]
MRYSIPALIGLATVVVAQNSTTDCITAFSKCYDFDSSNGNLCSGQASTCKDLCSTSQSNCLSSGKSKSACSSAYDSCVGATSSSVVSLNCIASVTPCYTGNGSVDNTCDSMLSECKTSCSAIRDICESTGNDNGELCAKKYTTCLGADTVSSPSKSCIAQAEEAYTTGSAFNDLAALVATCKNECGVLQDACMTSGNTANCASSYDTCLGSASTESSVHCVSEIESLIQSGARTNDVESSNAQCKDYCARSYDTCNSSGKNAESDYLNSTTLDNSDDASLADCKGHCGMLYSTCLSSGDESVKEGCLAFYSGCTSGNGTDTSSLNCVASNEQCYLNGTNSDLECDSSNAQCKNACTRQFSTCTSSGDSSVDGTCSEYYESRSQDTCLSGNSTSVVSGCNEHYSQCLGSADVDTTSPVSCVEIATKCFLEGTADNDCASVVATCKSSCSRSQDTCLSSGDASVKPGCQKRYDTCLGATPEAEEAAKSIDCIERFTSCYNSGLPLNTLLDSCNSSGDNSTDTQCQGVYNSCLGSIATSLVDYKPLDCAGHAKLCASNGTASNQCDQLTADCGTACGITLDLCLVSGSSDRAACNHLYMMCQDASSYKVTSIPASLKPTVSLSSAPGANATKSTAMITGTGSGAISTGGAYVNGSSSTANAQSGAVSIATYTESTVYVTDVVKTTVTTCPVGQTLTTAGSTTVLTAPSVITTSVTVKSTISTIAVHTITVPAAGNNAVPTSKASTSIESTVYVTDVVKETVTTCPIGQTLTTAGSTTVLTAPSVITSKFTIQSTVSAFVTHTASAPQSSPVSPEQTTPASVDGHVAVPSTVTLYSTKEVTITSCAADVTDCPARSTVVSTTLFPTAITVSSVWSRTSSASAVASASGSAPAGSSPISPETTSAPVTVASTMFYYSTAVVTVTSCAEGVENCPAHSTVVQTSVIPTGYAVTSVISSAFTPIEYTSPSAAVPESSAPAVSAPAPVVPTTAPFAVTNSTMMSVGPVGTGIVGTGSGSKATSTYSPSQYTGAANKVGAAGLAGVAAFAAFLI